ncbi:MAG: hypothetical protein IKP62_09130 [Salinivirgaceae bacterium]|nr:hypothetical protein [Salinivirgaceae bacterium]
MRDWRDKTTIVTSILCLALLTSCGGLSKMAEDARFIQWEVSPKVLEMRNGDVEVELMVTFPPKYFQAAAVVQITPVLKYDGKEKIFDRSIRVQGEAVQANNEICSFANGGTFRTKSKIRFEEKMRCSELYIRATVSMRGQPIDLPEQKVACGVIAPFTNFTTANNYFAGTEWLLLNKYCNVALPPKAKAKNIDYPSGYSVECYFLNDEMADNLPFTITDKTNGKVIFEGFAIDNHKKFVGTWKKGENESVCGTFTISNTNDGNFSLKAKKTTNPSFTVQKINSYITRCGYNPVLIDFSHTEYSGKGSLIVCNIEGKNNWFESSIDKSKAQQMIQDVRGAFSGDIKGKITAENDGYTFNGMVVFDDKSGGFVTREGKRTYTRGKYREVEISKNGSNSHRVSFSYFNISEMLLKSNSDILKSVTLKDDDFYKIKWWTIDDYIKNANEVEVAYSNGDSFIGTATYINGKVVPKSGVYTYSNGDKFTGSVESKSAGGIFVNGTTTFANNNQSVSGNWLSKYQLTASQLSEISKRENPSSKRRYIEGIQKEGQFFTYISNGDKAFQEKKYDDAERWYTLAINSIPTDMHLQEESLRNKLERIKEAKENIMYETVRTESIRKGDDKYVVEYTRVGYRLIGYDDKGRKKFEYENRQNGHIDLKTWNMVIPTRGKMIKYSYNSRGVLSSRQYYNESQSYYLDERQRDDGSFHCEGIYENAGEYMDDILIDVGYDSGFWTVQYPIYRNDPKTGEKKQIATLCEKELKEWLLDYLYKLD